MDSSRLKIRYAEEGGVDKDGIVEFYLALISWQNAGDIVGTW